ncbi:MAG: hypothetical protein ABIB79_01385 [archaeon]
MNKLTKRIYGFRLSRVKNRLRSNAEEIRELFNNWRDYLKNYNEQLRLMSCRSYLENKLSTII